MELADATERVFYIRDKETKQFADFPAEVHEYEEIAGQCCIRHRKDEKVYSYGRNRVRIATPKRLLDPKETLVRRRGRAFDSVDRIAVYEGCIAVRFSNGTSKVYAEGDIFLEEDALKDPRLRNVFDYLREVAATDELLNENTKRPILEERYAAIGAVSSRALLSCYLSGSLPGAQRGAAEPLIYPFGLNASQKTAVERAFSDRLSVVQGPPGTGKTQTILNIIANNIMRGRTTAVVSNNSSAVENVVEKLDRADVGFVCALLGKDSAKEAFIENQPDYPEIIRTWKMPAKAQQQLLSEVDKLVHGLTQALQDQKDLAETEAAISALEREYEYFKSYAVWRGDGALEAYEPRPGRTSASIMRFWVREERRLERQRPAGIWYRAYVWARYGSFYLDAVDRGEKSVPLLQNAFYRARLDELQREARRLGKSTYDFESGIAAIEAKSLQVFKARLADRYRARRSRPRFSKKELWSDSPAFAKEYPVILSTTHSVITSLNPGFMYDSVLMDESSQIGIAAGALALACADSAVVVGDHKQLANVVKKERMRETEAIANRRRIPSCYRYERHSMLTSVLALWPSVEPTLLREHYRCHPQIIGFCNKMYYDGELIVMTKDEGESNVLAFYRTVAGNHERGHANRRQVAVVCEEIIPNLTNYGIRDIGVIAPFNAQVRELKKEVPEDVPVATVHKFQGRENDAIVLSTVEDTIGNFAGDPQLVNVAVSRAVKKLRVVASQNERGSKNNGIEELARYIEYNGFEIIQSEIRSVFDLLYKAYADERRKYLSRHKRVSHYDSENLMAAALEDMLGAEEFARVSFRCHVALAALVGEDVSLSPRERDYVINPCTHVDFVFFREMNKRPLLCVEVDAWQFHREGTDQYARDRMKDAILERCGLPLLRLRTDSKGERHDVGRIKEMLKTGVADVSSALEAAVRS